MLNGTGCFVHICAFPLLSPFPLLGTFPLPFLSPFLSLITPSPSHATFSRIPLYFSPVQSSPAQQASKQASNPHPIQLGPSLYPASPSTPRVRLHPALILIHMDILSQANTLSHSHLPNSSKNHHHAVSQKN